MHIILTHEQADFDALASLLGAYLLEEQAAPVLPRRLNRNVRAFLTLYGLELPFIEQRDLPPGKLESVTLVDTQSLITLKGLDNETRVIVIDHHEPRPDLPKDWEMTCEQTGANTTPLVEALQSREISLSMPQATLLLLGIYEDTGGLTYTRTTARDARAAAFLLEQGASLQIAQRYLNHPLSVVQQGILDNLRQNAQAHSIHGYNILIAHADATHTDEELSTIAHKLRDLLDPDGLIILVMTGAGAQIIARATTDEINVGDLMVEFGGGGHPRAAAALVKDKKAKLEDLQTEILEHLPAHIRPSLSVEEIMSRSPQILSPDTPVREAAALMQRYGYEGYPVVSKEGLVGLLTRRAVDRAMGHGLNMKIREIMSAGNFTIAPNESIEALQRLMTDSGWGQIPVTDPARNEIVGIVTRTDVLKTLTPQETNSGRQNLAGRLEDSLPPARLALLKAVAETAQERQDALYIVGGFVRDLLLERPSLDLDLVVEGDGIQLGAALSAKYGGKVHTHKRFGTAKWHLAEIAPALARQLSDEFDLQVAPADLPDSLDLVSARREFYTHPSALPTVERGSIKLDLHRRDFTINTLALRLDGRYYGELHDHWGGVADLQKGSVRVLHSLSFVDDPTRILRAVRFEQRFGYQISARTLELLDSALGLLGRVSGDRLRHELNMILREENWAHILARLAELNVLGAIHDSLSWDEEIRTRLVRALDNAPEKHWQFEKSLDGYPFTVALTYALWFIPLDSLAAASLCGRLKLPGWLTKAVLAASQLRPELPALIGQPPSAITRRLEQAPHLTLFALLVLEDDPRLKELINNYALTWQHVQAHIDGNELRRRNIPPGPRYRKILDALRAAWLDGQISSEAQEMALLENLINDQPTTA